MTSAGITLLHISHLLYHFALLFFTLSIHTHQPLHYLARKKKEEIVRQFHGINSMLVGNLLKFNPSFNMGKKGDLRDFEHAMVCRCQRNWSEYFGSC